jgi:hypothetical protein
MNTLVAIILGVLVFYLAYTFYAKRVDAQIIRADPKKATPAKMYMDGTNSNPSPPQVPSSGQSPRAACGDGCLRYCGFSWACRSSGGCRTIPR